MSGRLALLILTLLAITTVASASLAASPPTLTQQLAKSKANNRTLRLANADLRDQVSALNAVAGDQGDQIARLQSKIANQPAPLDAVLSGSPDDLWAAMVAIWKTFPTLDPGALCGYDKGNVPGSGDGLSLTSWTFYRWSGC